jgi:hypothetical protein
MLSWKLIGKYSAAVVSDELIILVIFQMPNGISDNEKPAPEARVFRI